MWGWVVLGLTIIVVLHILYANYKIRQWGKRIDTTNR